MIQCLSFPQEGQALIRYIQPVYRPPSEADSLILQATTGCSHNRCCFCYMYRGKRFSVRRWEDLRRDIEEAAALRPATRRIFLADGDAFVMSSERLKEILDYLDNLFPRLERVSCYANPQNLMSKSVAGMKELASRGLSILYYGVESGDPDLLRKINKGCSPDEMAEGCLKAHRAGMKLSVTVILGLAGRTGSASHARLTAELINRINPRYLSVLTLMLGEHRAEYQAVMGSGFQFNSAVDDVRELRKLISALNVDRCIFRSNHASNHLPLKGTLMKGRDSLIEKIDQALLNPESYFKDEWMRGL